MENSHNVQKAVYLDEGKPYDGVVDELGVEIVDNDVVVLNGDVHVGK